MYLCALLSYILTTPSGRPGLQTDRQGRVPLRVPFSVGVGSNPSTTVPVPFYFSL